MSILVHTMMVSLLSLLTCVSTLSHGTDCECPEMKAGWEVYPDSAIGAPDFYQRSSIPIREILICEGGAHLFFDAKQDGETRNVCLVVAEVTFEEWFNRIPADSVPSEEDIALIEQDHDFERLAFRKRVDDLKNVLGDRARVNERVVFKMGWFHDTPKVYPGAPILVKWHGRRAELTGKVDVYFTD